MKDSHFVKSEILNPKHETNPKFEFSNVQNMNTKELFRFFGHLDFGNLDLPFGFAQGGELVEPFRI